MAEGGKVAYVLTIPPCDICAENSRSTPREELPLAVYDGRTKMGPWAYMCSTHFGLYGPGRLGIGYGQRLVLDTERTDLAGSMQRHPAGKGL